MIAGLRRRSTNFASYHNISFSNASSRTLGTYQVVLSNTRYDLEQLLSGSHVLD